VQRGIDHGWWDELDYFSVHAIHSNSNGIHLLNWVLPAGGSNVVTNGDFSNGSTGWTGIGGNTSVTDGKLVYTDADLVYQSCLEIGKYYQITYTISDYSAGTFKAQCGTTVGTSRNANGTYTEVLKCTGDTNLDLFGVSPFAGKIDDVVVKEWQNGIEYNSPTFTAYEGVTGNPAAGAYVNSRFNAYLSGVNYKQNDACFGSYIRNDPQPATYQFQIGAKPASNWVGAIQLSPFISGSPNVLGGRVHSNTGSSAANDDPRGLNLMTRDASDSFIYVLNKSTIYTSSVATDGLVNGDIFLWGINENGSVRYKTEYQAALHFLCGHLSQTLRDHLTDDFEEYMDSYGKGVID
jgi:hypothetical protein